MGYGKQTEILKEVRKNKAQQVLKESVTAEGNASIELDIDLEGIGLTLDANTVSNLRDFLLYHGVEELDDVKIKVIKERGPGGGLPLVGFTGSKKSLLNVYEWYSMDDPTWIDDARELYPQLFESCSSTAGDETEKEVYHMLSHEELYKEIMSMIEEEGRTSIADKELATKIIAKFEELMKWRKVPRRK